VRLGRSKFFRSQQGRQISELREVGNFGRLERSGNWEVWKDWEGARIGRILSPVFATSCRLCKLSFR
jgi:hypothetical protein